MSTIDLTTVVAIGSTILSLGFSGYVAFFRLVVSQWQKAQEAKDSSQDATITAQKVALDLALERLRSTEHSVVSLQTNQHNSDQTVKEIKQDLKEINDKLDKLLLNRKILCRNRRNNMQGITRIFQSSKALIVLFTVLCLTVLTAMGKIDAQSLMDFLKITLPTWLLAQGAEDAAAKYNPVGGTAQTQSQVLPPPQDAPSIAQNSP
jgi:hypothetical protein